MITSFTLENNLQLTLELDTPRFGLSPDALFGLAARQNPQRAFLFVSKVLGICRSVPARFGRREATRAGTCRKDRR
ncbi:MAG: phosphoribosyltransferase domain-containing protein [Merdibacter sp.]